MVDRYVYCILYQQLCMKETRNYTPYYLCSVCGYKVHAHREKIIIAHQHIVSRICQKKSISFAEFLLASLYLHLISHLALRQSQSMIPSLHSLLFPVVYPKVPYLAHSFLLSILLLLARWSQKIPSNTICTLMTPSCTSLSLLQILLYVLKHLPPLSLTFFPGWTWTNCSSILLKLNFFLLAQNNSVSNFLILQTYLSAMISSQSVPLLAILASSLTLTCLSLNKSTLFPNLVIFTSKTSVEFVIFFLFLQPQPLQIHLSPANLTTAIHFTLASHNQISTNFNAFKTHWHASLQTLQNINTSHQH